MKKSDDGLKIDILDIFGDDWAKPSTPVSPPASVEPTAKIIEEVAPPPVEIPIEPPEVKFNDPGIPLDVPKEEPIAEEVPVAAEPIAPPAVEENPPAEAVIEAPSVPPEVLEFFSGYDEFRKIVLDELKDSAGIKKTCVMLVRTFELAREKYPEIFRNANWDENGNLLEDGSLDPKRVFLNKSALEPAQADMILDTALITLLNLRLQSVEKGLGVDVRNKTRSRMKKWLTDEIQTAGNQSRDPTSLKRLNHYLL